MQSPDPVSVPVEFARKARGYSRKLPSPQVNHASSVSLQGIQVLVIDEPGHARTLEEYLAATGCKVRTARTASDALAVLATFPARAVIVELVLPGMGGLLLTRALKSDPATQNLIVIALSTVNGPAVERIAKEAGCNAYLQKPIPAAVVAQTLAHYLKEQR
jgi:CheY-like chemotaxis protein